MRQDVNNLDRSSRFHLNSNLFDLGHLDTIKSHIYTFGNYYWSRPKGFHSQDILNMFHSAEQFPEFDINLVHILFLYLNFVCILDIHHNIHEFKASHYPNIKPTHSLSSILWLERNHHIFNTSHQPKASLYHHIHLKYKSFHPLMLFSNHYITNILRPYPLFVLDQCTNIPFSHHLVPYYQGKLNMIHLPR